MNLLRYSFVGLVIVLGFLTIVASSPCPCPERFTDMGDGTVKDNHSGLIWLKDASALGLHSWDDATGTETTDIMMLFNDGKITATDYTAGAYTDWRLPDVDELLDFWNRKCSIRCLKGSCNVNGFIGVQAGYYWSSTELDAALAWHVSTHIGYEGLTYKFEELCVWPVRYDL